VATFQEFHDPHLVALYDTLNPFAADTAFYIELAAALCASSIIDIGCGTGLLTCELARRGHRMTGVDPSSAMLDVARHRPGGERVRWIEGGASRLDHAQADLAIMTSHVGLRSSPMTTSGTQHSPPHTVHYGREVTWRSKAAIRVHDHVPNGRRKQPVGVSIML